MQTQTDTKTKTAFELHAAKVEARAKVKIAKTGVQEYAIDLYERGFNVFPIPTAYDWNLRGETLKKPYILMPLFLNRLHYAKVCECKTCNEYNFVDLFADSNIAIMCGATSGNLIDVDCDSQESFRSMEKELTRHGLEFWAFTSHRGGGYLLRVREGVIADIPQAKSRFADVQIWGGRHFVVIPPSIHPKGTPYKWQNVEPLNMLPRETLKPVNVSALEWLGVTLQKNNKTDRADQSEDLSGLPEYAINLLPMNRKTLRSGASLHGRNSALVALAADLVGIQLDRAEVINAVTMAADNCSPEYPSDKGETPISEIVDWAFSKPRKAGLKYQRKVGKGIQDWQRAKVFADSFEWRAVFGGKSSYARRVYDACIKRSQLDSRSKVFRAAAREMSIETNIHSETVSRYLRLLVSKGLLKREDSEKSGAAVFSFVFASTLANSNSEVNSVNIGQLPYSSNNIDLILYGNCPTQNASIPSTDAERDAFHGLGIHAFRIWRALLLEPARSVYEIAKRLKINKGTAGKTVSNLVLAGLAFYSQSEGVYYGNALTDAQLERKATDRGANGHTRDKRAGYVLEREKYANRLVFKAKDDYKDRSASMEQTR